MITDKKRQYTFRDRVTERLIKEIKQSVEEDIIIVHGGGSFGHPGAEQYRLNTERPMEYDKGAAEVQLDMRRLNNRILQIMIKEGLWAMSIPGAMVSIFKDGELVEFNDELFKRYLSIGTIPVTFGDVAVDLDRGVTICSGDDLMLELADMAQKAFFVSDVEGIYKEGEHMDVFTEKMLPISEEDNPNEADAIDVTGGMNKKIEVMLRISDHCGTYIVNGTVEGRLRKLLKGEEVIHTEVKR